MVVRQPLELVDMVGKLDLYITVKVVVFSGQAGAIRHGITRALMEYDETLRSELRKAGVTRDARQVERKKVGRVKHVVVRSSPVNFRCFGSAIYRKTRCFTGFFMPEIRRPRLKSVAYQTIQHEFAALPPQNKQNLVNYHPLLRLFAVQLTSWAGFYGFGSRCVLPACGKIIQDSSLSVGYSQYFLDNLEVFMAVAANKRSVMTLFSGPTDIFSHQVRIVLAERCQRRDRAGRNG